MFLRFIIGIILVLVAILNNSCATIISRSKQDILITASVDSSKVYLDRTFKGFAPLKMSLERGVGYMIEIKHEGYETYAVKSAYTINYLVLGNILVPMLASLPIIFSNSLVKDRILNNADYYGIPLYVGSCLLLIDYMSGATYRNTPTYINAVLERKNSPPK